MSETIRIKTQLREKYISSFDVDIENREDFTIQAPVSLDILRIWGEHQTKEQQKVVEQYIKLRFFPTAELVSLCAWSMDWVPHFYVSFPGWRNRPHPHGGRAGGCEWHGIGPYSTRCGQPGDCNYAEIAYQAKNKPVRSLTIYEKRAIAEKNSL